MTELFAKLHDKNFRVTVPGFYDDVAKVSKAERKALNALPWKKKDFEKAVGAPGYFGERGFTTVERLWTRPTLELNGIWGGYQGEGAKTVIPSKAFAKFSTRLVPDQDPHKIAKLVEKHDSQTAAENRALQVRSSQHRQAVDRSVSRADFQEGSGCAWKKASARKRYSFVKAARFPSSRRCTTPSKCPAS